MKKPVFFILFATTLSLLICCNSPKGNFFKPIVYSENGTKLFAVGVHNNDTIFVKVDNENLKIDDGYTKEDSVYYSPEIIIGKRIVFKFSNNDAYLISCSNIQVLNINSSNNYILLKDIDNLFGEKYKVIHIRDGIVSTFTSFASILGDIDDDGFYEVGGSSDIEGYSRDCDSGYYSPALIYKLGDKFVLDSINSKRLTLDKYEIFLGYNILYTPVRFNKKYIDSTNL